MAQHTHHTTSRTTPRQHHFAHTNLFDAITCTLCTTDGSVHPLHLNITCLYYSPLSFTNKNFSRCSRSFRVTWHIACSNEEFEKNQQKRLHKTKNKQSNETQRRKPSRRMDFICARLAAIYIRSISI